MKKILLMMLAVLSIGLCAYAQLNEVRGVLTKEVTYKSGSSYYCGYSFTNENNYSVWIEAELWIKTASYENKDNYISDTKSFTLKPGETYLWRNEIGEVHRHGYYVKYKAYKAQ